ncbi:MAG: Rrf2 family transcriptional regulator [Candidatus Eisenbacteria bacterium]|nr:Rrf2 family transcriptional regulator [Candidatus Eisenbacteria bacterium]
MEFTPSRSQGHLIVAAVRILAHQRKRPPATEEIAELLGISRELVLHILRGLESRGIVRSIETPFEIRIDIEDHTLLEGLPEKQEGPDVRREIEDFQRKAGDRQKKIERMMREGDPARKTRESVSKIEREFREFRKKDRSRQRFEGQEPKD